MSIYKKLARLEDKGERAVICTVISANGSTPRHIGSKMIVSQDGTITGTIGGGEMENRVINIAEEVMATNKPQLIEFNLSDPEQGDPGICGGQMEVFVEPVQPNPTIVVIGAGHVGKAVVHLADWLGYHVALSDDRAEFCTPEAIPGADEYLHHPIKEISKHIKIHQQTFLVLATRNSGFDVDGLPSLLDSNAAYIGIIGSKRRWELTRNKLVDLGISEEKLDSIHSPMGLDINAETPEEIAISVLSQIISIRNDNSND